MSSLPSFAVFAFLLSNLRPLTTFLVCFCKLQIKLLRWDLLALTVCLIDTKPPYLLLIRWYILNPLPQGHFLGVFAMFHPYHKRTAAQKCCFDSSKSKYLIGSAVRQFHTPFFMLISSNLVDFPDRLFLNWSKLVWRWSSFSFLITCLATLIWVLSTLYCLF